MPSFQKPKTPTKMKIVEEEEKCHDQYFLEILDMMFFVLPKSSFLRVFLVFETKESLNLSALQKTFLDKILHSNGVKKPKS